MTDLPSGPDDRDRALAEAQQEIFHKDRLIGLLAHELLAPVATVLLWETILRDARDAEQRRQALDAIRRSAQCQAALVACLLDLARAFNGTLELERRPLAIGDVVKEVLDGMAPVAVAKQLDIDRTPGAEHERVSADPVRLRQILAGALSRLVDWADPGDRIVVAARREESSIVVLLSAGRTRTPEPDHGSTADGIELALARKLASAHGGLLEASRPTEAPGPGFKLSLPALTSP